VVAAHHVSRNIDEAKPRSYRRTTALFAPTFRVGNRYGPRPRKRGRAVSDYELRITDCMFV